MEPKTTGELLKLLCNTHSVSDLQKYQKIHTTNTSFITFSNAFLELMQLHDLNKADIVKDSLLDRTYAYQILNGTKNPGRDKIIALCLAANFTLKETQHLLTCASEGILYSRSSRDAVLIYSIEHHLNVFQVNDLLFQSGEKILE